MGPKLPELPKNWDEIKKNLHKKIRHNSIVSLLKTLTRYLREKANPSGNISPDVVDAHIEVIKFILEKEKNFNLENFFKKRPPRP